MINLKSFCLYGVFFLFASGLLRFDFGDLKNNLTEAFMVKKALAATPTVSIGGATEGRRTGNCSYISIIKEYTCASYNEGRSVYDGTNKGSTFGDIGHAWSIFDGLNTNNADEKTYNSCGQSLRTGGQVDKWTCENSGSYKWVNKGSVTTPVTLEGSINPNGNFVGYVFGYFLYNDSSSTWTPWQDYGFTGSSDTYVRADVALTPGTKYFYKLWLWDYTTGKGYFSGINNFETFGVRPTSPTATTNSPTNITKNSVTINGTAYPDGDYISYGFNGNLPSMPPWVIYGKGTSNINASYNISGLTPGTTYSYELVLYNYYTGKEIKGGIKTFTTPLDTLPTVTSLLSSNITSTSAYLKGVMNTKGNSGLTFKFCLNGTWWCSGERTVYGNYDRQIGLDTTKTYNFTNPATDPIPLSPNTTYSLTIVVMQNGNPIVTSNSTPFTTLGASSSSSSSSNYDLTIEKNGNGRGYVTVTSITSGEIKCEFNKYIKGQCKKNFPKNETIVITATPISGSTFNGFGGCSSGCNVSNFSATISNINSSKNITVNFN